MEPIDKRLEYLESALNDARAARKAGNLKKLRSSAECISRTANALISDCTDEIIEKMELSK